jgi:hypothetical protein
VAGLGMVGGRWGGELTLGLVTLRRR